MVFIGAKVSDQDLIDWLKSKSNQSEIIKEALKEKKQRELNQDIQIRAKGKIVGVKL